MFMFFLNIFYFAMGMCEGLHCLFVTLLCLFVICYALVSSLYCTLCLINFKCNCIVLFGLDCILHSSFHHDKFNIQSGFYR
jgi:hypothetical protein